MPEPIERILVVVPARDEALLVEACLDAIARAAAAVDVPVTVVVVSDGSVDRTAVIAREHGATVIEIPGAGVGAARAAGAEHALALAGDLHRTWLTSTDADSRVAADWFQVHRAFADAGADAVVGTIRLTEADELLHPGWTASYHHTTLISTDGHHGHVHGANLGVRGSVYREVGGFHPLDVHEDVDLVDRLDRHGAHVVRTTAAAVVTSGRIAGRVVGGVADDLRGTVEA